MKDLLPVLRVLGMLMIMFAGAMLLPFGSAAHASKRAKNKQAMKALARRLCACAGRSLSCSTSPRAI